MLSSAKLAYSKSLILNPYNPYCVCFVNWMGQNSNLTAYLQNSGTL